VEFLIALAAILVAGYFFIWGCLYLVQWIERGAEKLKAKIPGARDPNRWACPFCKAVFEKTPQMKSMSREPGATIVVLASQNPRCPGCHAELDGQKMLDGRYDLRLPIKP